MGSDLFGSFAESTCAALVVRCPSHGAGLPLLYTCTCLHMLSDG